MTPPRCSVVIPVHNKALLTRQCLDSILESPPETPHELIVVDDASTDSTRSCWKDSDATFDPLA